MNTTDEIMKLAMQHRHAKTPQELIVAHAALNNSVNELVEQAKWAHHTPALLSDADAAADLAGVARPGACDPAPDGVCEALECGNHGAEPALYIHPDTFAMASAHVGAWKPGHELEGYIPLYTSPQASQPERYIVPEFIPIAQRKLAELMADGYQVTGYSIERTRDDIVQRGAVTCGGMVLWWHGDSQTVQARQPLTNQQIEEIITNHNYRIHGDRPRYIARAIEAAHGIGAAQKGKP